MTSTIEGLYRGKDGLAQRICRTHQASGTLMLTAFKACQPAQEFQPLWHGTFVIQFKAATKTLDITGPCLLIPALRFQNEPQVSMRTGLHPAISHLTGQFQAFHIERL